MSDYLSRAVDREISGILSVRPALPSAFDSGNSSAIVTAPEPENPMEGEPSRNSSSETKAENSPASPAPLAAVDALWAEAAATPEPPRIAEVTAEKTSADVVATPVATSTVEGPQSESHSPAQQPQPGEVVVRPTTKTPPPRPPLVPALEQVAQPVTRSPLNGPRPISPSDGDPPISPIARETTAGANAKAEAPIVRSTTGDTKAQSEAPIARSTTGDAKAKAEAPPAVGPVTPVVTPAPSRSERAANARAPRHDASSPRAIHITIGRIEVRAVHPPPEPPPQQRPAPVSPKISLGEYLKQRNGDRR